MPFFAYNRDIPDAPNNPSDDQPNMKTNTNSTDDIIDVDHYSFETTGPVLNIDGFHKQCTFAEKNVPGAQTDPTSVLYTNSGTASTVAEAFYRNQNAILPVSAVKAFGVLTVSAAPIAGLDNGFNATASGSGVTYIVVLATGVVTGNNVVVIFSASAPSLLGTAYTFTNPNLVFTTNSVVGTKLSFVVLQA